MMLQKMNIGFDSPDLQSQADDLAQRFQFNIHQSHMPRLQLTKQGLVLLIANFSPLKVDFDTFKKIDKQHALIRACKPAPGIRILDLTAGWGRDAGLLAKFGAQVTMVERQPCMAALLENGLQRMRSPLDLRLIYQDANDYLTQLSTKDVPDVIYIDPMHPERQKTALVKKDMQALQQLFGPDNDAQSLLELALQKAKQKVILKWPRYQDPWIPTRNCIIGKTICFYIYTARGIP